jgi:hypothetical protein
MRTTPPTMHALMEEPLFRAYMKRIPPAHNANLTGTPWQLWVSSGGGRWLTRAYASYRDVWPVFVSRLRAGDDPTITSRRIFYAPPGEWYRVKVRCNVTLKNPNGYRVENRWRQLFWWDPGLEWCGRCRRPTYWMPLFSDHHALRKLPAVSEEDNVRCTICGIRWIAMPSIDQMEKQP